MTTQNETSPAVERAERAGRAQDLAPVLESLAFDLAVARRQCAALSRENAKLRAQLLCLDPSDESDDIPATSVGGLFQSTRPPGGPLHCGQCGLTIHGTVAQHDQTLLLAAVCPRCDGPLARDAACAEVAATPRAEAPISLG